MPRTPPLILLAALAFGGTLATAATPASAHGWHRHHHHPPDWHYRHRGRLHYYGPRYRWSTSSLYGWTYGCGLRRVVTYYGALAYREVCY